jgi:quercetin dioxygenase-like cupin family protein
LRRRYSKAVRSGATGGDCRIARSDILAETGGNQPDWPNSKLVEQSPGSVLQTHYHVVDQFQVFVAGAGWIGKSEARPVVVHYANAFTGYGPLTAGPEGLAYLVFRLGVDPGAAWLPEARAGMKNVPRRVVHSRQVDLDRTADAAGGSQLESLLGDHPDGLRAELLRLGPGKAHESRTPEWRGRFIHVLRGELESSDTGCVLRAGTCIALERGESIRLSATSAGAQLLLLQFPRSAS